MWAVPVVLVQPEWKVFSALVGGVIGTRIGPFVQRSLDEAFGFAVGSRGVGPSAVMFKPQAVAQSSEAPGLVAGAVIGQQSPELDTQRGIVADCSQQGRAGAVAGFIGINRAEGDSRVVVNGDVDILPAGPGGVLPAVAGYPVAGAVKRPRFLMSRCSNSPGASYS